MSFPRYPRYKDSGVEWLGEVPEHWRTAPLKTVVSYNDEVLPESTDSNCELQYVDISSVDAVVGIAATETLAFGDAPSRARRIVRHGDVIISTVRTYLRAIAAIRRPPPNLIVSTGFAVVRPRQGLLPEFLSYAVSAGYFLDQVVARSTGVSYPAINAAELVSIPVIIPPQDEQAAVAGFLDRETAKIDALITEQQRLIELLKEKRQAVISHAVTRGLNPDAPMKPSGVEWLVDVPAHWEIGPLKRFCTSLNDRRIPLSGEVRAERSGEFPYYGASGIIDWIDDYIFEEDTVLVSEDGANLLQRSTPIAFTATGQYWVNNHAHILRPADALFGFWAERLDTINLEPVVSGSAQPKLTSEALMNLIVSVPPTYEERATIQGFIAAQSSALQPLIKEAERAITLLQERRTALISAAVTGKIDVRGIAMAEAA
jgi:type I restriction enzyme S subunit